jgi:hypothetical protein
MALGSIEHMENCLAATPKPATGARVGRKLEYPEKREAAFKPGTLARIQAVLRDDEPLVAFIREAVDRELQRRRG